MINYISGERLFPYGSEIPSPVKIAVNVNLLSAELKGESNAEIPFVFVVNYIPSVAQITIKGHVIVSGSDKEINEIIKAQKEKKPPPRSIMQSVLTTGTAEAVIISRSIGVPPPVATPAIPSQLGNVKVKNRGYTI